MPLTLIAHIHAVPEKREAVLTALQTLVLPTRAEAGCLGYTLHTDNNDPAHFVFYEIWEDKAAMDRHMATPHIAAFRAATEGMITQFTLHELTKSD